MAKSQPTTIPSYEALQEKLDGSQAELLRFHKEVVNRLFGILERMVGKPPAPPPQPTQKGMVTGLGLPPGMKGGSRGVKPKITQS